MIKSLKNHGNIKALIIDKSLLKAAGLDENAVFQIVINSNGGITIQSIQKNDEHVNKRFLHETIFDRAAAYLFHICKNYPFLDGNKRIAASSSLVFLKNNKVKVKFDLENFEKLILKTARGKVAKKQIGMFFEESNL